MLHAPLIRCSILALLLSSPASAQTLSLTERDRLAGLIRDGAAASTVEREWLDAVAAAGRSLTLDGARASADDVVWRGATGATAAAAETSMTDIRAALGTLMEVNARIVACGELMEALEALAARRPSPPPEGAAAKDMAYYTFRLADWSDSVTALERQVVDCVAALDGQMLQFDLQRALDRMMKQLSAMSAIARRAHSTAAGIIANLK